VAQAKPTQPNERSDDRQASTVATLLRGFRVAAGLSQAELAERADVSTGAIGSLEQGLRRAPYRSTLASLADALQLTPEQRDQLYDVAMQSRGRRRNPLPQATFSSNVPARLTSFIRRAETAEIARLIAEHRLVTVTGVAGVGKTRTVIEVIAAYDVSDVLFLDLSPVSADAFVVAEIASAFGVPIGDDADAPAKFVNSVRDRRALIVLDNCEHVIAGVAAAVLELLRSSPHVKVVATSRERLGLSSEVVYRLPFLNVPPPGAALAIASEYGALALFVARAQAADARLSLSPEDLAAAADICRRLDGIPLAIELAAGRVSMLGITGLRDRLHELPLVNAAKDTPARHQTMASAIAWSFALLSPRERVLMRRLSTLAGNFTLRCAETVCADDLLPAGSIPDLIVQLIQKSLIESKAEQPLHRYSLLAAVRAFASQALVEADEVEANVDRAARYLLSLVPDPGARDESAFLMLADLDNIRVIVEAKLRFGSADDVATAGALVGSYRRLWKSTNRFLEIRRFGELIFAHLDQRTYPEIAAIVASAVAGTGRTSEMPQELERAAALNAHAGDFAAAAAHSSSLALFYVNQGRLDEGLDAAKRAEALLENVPRDHRAQRFVRANTAYVWCEGGDFAKAREVVAELDRLLGEQTSSELAAARDAVLAEIECAAGNYANARAICSEVRAKNRHDVTTEFYDLVFMLTAAAIDMKLDDIDSAAERCSEVLDNWEAFENHGIEHLAGELLDLVGAVVAARGDRITAAVLSGAADASFARLDRRRLRMQSVIAADLRASLEHGLQTNELRDLKIKGSQMTSLQARELMDSVLDENTAELSGAALHGSDRSENETASR
jgi:predicted ATPase/DNA-binding XRE family transcriptional regulator